MPWGQWLTASFRAVDAMSIRLMTAVWHHEGIQHRDHVLVLLAIADAANEDGLAWPSVQTLADKTRCSVSTVRRHIRAIEAAGWLTTDVRIGTSNVYQLAVSRLLNPGQSDRGGSVNLTDDPTQSDTPVNLTPRSRATGGVGHSYDRGGRSTVTDRTVSEPSVNRVRSTPGQSDTPTVKRTRTSAHTQPADWQPNDAHRTLATSRGIDVDLEAEKFSAYNEAHDRRMANWDAAFRQWLLHARPAQTGRPLMAVNGRPPVDSWKPAPSLYDPHAPVEDDL
jgi:hypothetical protein